MTSESAASTRTVGESVLYVPEEAHAADVDAGGDYVWTWKVLLKGNQERPATSSEISSRRRDPKGGGWLTRGQLPLTPDQPVRSWQATLSGGSDADASLDIAHPHGHVLHYDHRPYSKDKTPGTFHRQGD